MVFCKMLSLVAMCAAIWLAVYFAVATAGRVEGVAESMPDTISLKTSVKQVGE